MTFPHAGAGDSTLPLAGARPRTPLRSTLLGARPCDRRYWAHIRTVDALSLSVTIGGDGTRASAGRGGLASASEELEA